MPTKRRRYYDPSLSAILQEITVNLAIVVDAYENHAEQEPDTVKLLEYIGAATLRATQYVATSLQTIEKEQKNVEAHTIIDLASRRHTGPSSTASDR